MKRRGFLGALFGAPAVPVAAALADKFHKELVKDETPQFAQYSVGDYDQTMCTVCDVYSPSELHDLMREESVYKVGRINKSNGNR